MEVGQIDYDLAIAATSRVGAVDGADRLASAMLQDGLEHTDTTLCSRLRAAAAASQYDYLDQLVTRARTTNAPPMSARAYRIAIASTKHYRGWKRAMELFEWSEADGLRPDLALFNALLGVLAESGQVCACMWLCAYCMCVCACGRG